MPIFEYRCEDCSQEFEILLLNRGEKVRCPHCHSDRLHKLMSAHAVGGEEETICGDVPVCGEGACPSCRD